MKYILVLFLTLISFTVSADSTARLEKLDQFKCDSGWCSNGITRVLPKGSIVLDAFVNNSGPGDHYQDFWICWKFGDIIFFGTRIGSKQGMMTQVDSCPSID